MPVSQTRVYKVWKFMHERCRNPNCKAYPNYGGRGIRVCERWNSFAVFWGDMAAGYQSGLTLDRVNNDGNYEPGNCRWATWKVQIHNRRKPRRSGSSLKGVYWHSRIKKWQAIARDRGGKLTHLGYFLEKERAIEEALSYS